MEIPVYNKDGNIVAQTIIDEEDLNIILRKQRWFLNRITGYVRSRAGYLHRLIMGAGKGQIVDHINGNLLDNRKKNLRFCTHEQNMSNRKRPVSNTSGYKGVRFFKRNKTWSATVGYHNKKIWIGDSKNKEMAARLYDSGARLFFGKFARLNFPNEEPLELRERIVQKLFRIKEKLDVRNVQQN